ncbi:jg14268 [Pararge aegeria aegeria]|uniref:Jg14268 protein n=1 Tax=Pararge aegeria aegeria TaxID=348720 RepID=A0A8S4QUB2_9NEOP|nr:jg14268 [Pararge aegeria aegeria]
MSSAQLSVRYESSSFGHSMERLVVKGKVEGKQSRGRSPTRWTDIIKAATQTSIVQCSRNAEDRNKWRRIAGAAVAKENV